MTRPRSESVDSALQHVDESRRGFLGKLLAGTAAAAAIPAMSSVALGDDRPDRGKGKGDGKGRGDRPSPGDIAKRLIQQHDKDGDGALNEKELTAALEALFSRFAGKGKGRGDGKGKGDGRGKGKGDG